MMPRPNTEPNPRIPRIPLRGNVHNSHARAAHNNMVDDLEKYPVTMSLLEVIQNCPSQ